MIPATQQRVVLARMPDGVPVCEDFRLVEAPVGAPADGQFLATTIHLSLDPYLRSAIAGRHPGHGPLAVGDMMPGRGTARVVASRHPRYREGDYVLLETGWQQYVVSDGRGARRLDAREAPLSAALGVLGMPGLTAWAGTITLGAARPGETFLVSAASGAVGSAAGQLARIAGCRAVGLAGSPEKCRLAVEHFGFDACVNYREPTWREALAAATGGRVDLYFDNVGGDALAAALDLLAVGGRVVLCGLIGQYNAGVPLTVPLASIIKKRARVTGLVVYDHEPEFEAYLACARRWVAAGRLRFHEDRSVGLASAPAAFVRLMEGRNVGKALVVVCPEDAHA